MVSRGAAASAARWLAVGSVLIGPAVGARAATSPAQPALATITVNTTPPALPAQIRYGFDIKEWGKPRQLDRDFATDSFGSGRQFSVLRIPIYAGDPGPDGGQLSPSPQDINARLYEPVVAAVHEALRANPGTVVYANVKTPYSGASLFARWMQGPDFPDHYARLLFDYIAYMQSRNVPIHALGILNEVAPADLATVDGGRMSYAVAYARTVQRLKALIRDNRHNPYAPSSAVAPVGTYVGPDSSGPHNDLVARLDASGWGDTVDVAATHFYSRGLRHQSAQLSDFDAWSNGRTKWDTEFHWSQGPRQSYGYAEARDALLSIFANLDHGLSTLIWWNFGDDTAADPDYEVQAELQKQLVDSTAGRYYLPVPSGPDLSDSLAQNGFVARAFLDATGSGARLLQVWIVNDTAKTPDGVTLTTTGGAGVVDVVSRAWVADKRGWLSDTPTTLQPEVAGSDVVIGRIPPRSLVSVTVSLNP